MVRRYGEGRGGRDGRVDPLQPSPRHPPRHDTHATPLTLMDGLQSAYYPCTSLMDFLFLLYLFFSLHPNPPLLHTFIFFLSFYFFRNFLHFRLLLLNLFFRFFFNFVFVFCFSFFFSFSSLSFIFTKKIFHFSWIF